MNILQVEHVSKVIKKNQILDDISFSVHENEILGLVGPNGAGKSTLMKCIVGLYRLSSGSVKICGYDLKKDNSNALKNVGVSIEYPSLYPELTGHEHFLIMKNWKHLNQERVKEMEQFSDLKEHLKKSTKYYSMGMKQRLVLSLAMMSKPKLLIIDEPTNGLDPQAVFELRNKLLTICEEGTSILLSSHQLNELDKLASRVLFIKNGKILKEKNMDEIRQSHYIYKLDISNRDRALSVLDNIYIENGEMYLRCISKEMFSASLRTLIQNKISIFSICEVVQDLETYYKELYKD